MAIQSRSAEKERLAPHDWEDAALAVIASRGVGAVSVEALARQLGVTKGSFYWHFVDRAALLASALERWQARYTQSVIDALEAVTDPRQRLEKLIIGTDGSSEAWRVHVALSTSAHEPAVAVALARVSKQRIAYVEACYRALGFSKDAARSRAVLAYSAYLGFLHLKLEGPSEVPQGKKRRPYLTSVLEVLLPASNARVT
ncbi:MAG: TetR/AcrR family transcriptional regulator [Polyangiaceae bacterium]